MPITIQISKSITYKLKEERTYELRLLSKTKLPREVKRPRKRPIGRCGRDIILNHSFLGKEWSERAYRDVKSKFPIGEFIYQIVKARVAV